jgi:hypothetical protein
LEYGPILSLCQDDGIEMEKKKILLRLDPKIHEALKRWADDEFRSLNSHIEFLLKKSLRSNRREEAEE